VLWKSLLQAGGLTHDRYDFADRDSAVCGGRPTEASTHGEHSHTTGRTEKVLWKESHVRVIGNGTNNNGDILLVLAGHELREAGDRDGRSK
jgi:hypothetical protein